MALTKISRSLLDTGVSDSSDATAITIDSSERVLIGTDSGDSFNSDSMLRLQRTGDRVFMQFKTDADQNSGILFGDVDDDVECAIEYEPANQALTLSTGNNAEAMRINSSGHVGIGTTTINSGTLGSNNTFLEVAAGTASGSGTLVLSRNTSTNNVELGGVRFVNANNADDDGLDADGKLVAAVSARSVTSDSNAGDDSGADLIFYTKPEAGNYVERMRITSNGFTKHSITGTYDTYSGADDSHQFVANNTGHSTLWVTNTNTAYDFSMIRAESARTPNSAFTFLTATTGNLTDDQFKLRGDGNAYADGTWSPNGADYAEYFEWVDGNTSNEDRRGYSVVLDNNKIRKATDSDNATDIIGVISGNPSVIGDSSWNGWNKKYLKDDYGSYILDENGDRTLNAEYDETQTYISREDRQEWDIVGLMGKVRINKNQPVGDRWIKMRDISETVEEWFIK